MHDDVLCVVLCVVLVIKLLPTHTVFDLAGCCSVRQRGVLGRPQQTTVSPETSL